MLTPGLSFLVSSLALSTLFPECRGTSVGFARWSLWSSWSPCSRTCGGGTTTRTRTCQPGLYQDVRWRHRASGCSGELSQSNLCNKQRCPEGSANFADVQCSQYNDKEIAGQRVKTWLADNNGMHNRNPCELRCRSEDSATSYSFGKMANGTSCSPEGVCFRGRCTRVGCDDVVGSRTRADMCGVCGGRNLTCLQVQQMYSSAHGQIFDYTPVTVIPSGATNVHIEEHAKNFLALLEGVPPNKSSRARFAPHVPGELQVGGTIFTYEIEPDHSESFSSSGPTKGPVTLMIFLTERGNQDVRYEYWIPKDLASGDQKATDSDAISGTTPLPQKESQETTKKNLPWTTKHTQSPSPSRSERSHSDHIEVTSAALDDEPRTEVDKKTTGSRGSTLDNRIPIPPVKESGKETGKGWQSFFWGKTSASTVVPMTTVSQSPGVGTVPYERITQRQPRKPKKPRKKPKKTRAGSCPRCHRIKDQLGHFCNSDVAAHVKVLSTESMERGEVRYDVAVLESFRNVFALQQREFLWSPNATCPCPRLGVGHEYVVMGRLEANYRRKESRLVADSQSFVRRYNEKRGRQLRRLRRLRSRKCNRIL